MKNVNISDFQVGVVGVQNLKKQIYRENCLKREGLDSFKVQEGFGKKEGG